MKKITVNNTSIDECHTDRLYERSYIRRNLDCLERQ